MPLPDFEVCVFVCWRSGGAKRRGAASLLTCYNCHIVPLVFSFLRVDGSCSALLSDLNFLVYPLAGCNSLSFFVPREDNLF